MRNVISWKLRRLVKTVPFYLMLGIPLLLALVLIPSEINDGADSAASLLCMTQSNIASMLDLLAGLFAALCITHDLQNRFVSTAVMTGNALSSILISEFLGFGCTLFAAVFVPALTVYIIGLALFGLGEGIVIGAVFGMILNAIFSAGVYALICVAAFGLVIPFSFIVKSEGSSCIVNLLILIACWSAVQFLFEFAANKPVVETLFSFTAFGQVFMMCAGELTGLELFKSFGIAVVSLAVIYGVTYIILKKQELK